VVAEFSGAGAIGQVTSGGRLVGWLIPATSDKRHAEEIVAQGKLKLVRLENGSNALQEWLDERADELQVTSEPCEGRGGAGDPPGCPHRQWLSDDQNAGCHSPASAAGWDPPDVQFVTYYLRLATAARDTGMTVTAPADPPVANLPSAG
jgi:hypothetical protein